MKIICTESEKQMLIAIIRAGSDCTIMRRFERCDEFSSCAECVEKDFEWQIVGNGGDA